jgi:Spy/CpxP family protein refolding chaperone
MTRRVALAALLLLMTSAAFAQLNLPPGKWWRRDEIVRQLNLSEEQQDRIETVFRNSANDLIDMRAETEKQSIALRAALDQPQLDRNAIRQLAQKLNDARGRQFQRELMMLVDMREVLSDQQWNRMRNLLDRLGERKQQERQQDRQQQQPMNRPRPRMR